MIFASLTSKLSVSRSIAKVFSDWRDFRYSIISFVLISDLNSKFFLAACGFVSWALFLINDLNSYFLKKLLSFGESSKSFNFSIVIGSSRSFFRITSWWLIFAFSSWSCIRFLILSFDIFSLSVSYTHLTLPTKRIV